MPTHQSPEHTSDGRAPTAHWPRPQPAKGSAPQPGDWDGKNRCAPQNEQRFETLAKGFETLTKITGHAAMSARRLTPGKLGGCAWCATGNELPCGLCTRRSVIYKKELAFDNTLKAFA